MCPSGETDRLMPSLKFNNLIWNRTVRQSDSIKNCTLLGNCAATSANYLSKFRDGLSVPPSNAWRWDWRVLPKRRQLSTNPRSVTTQKSEHLIYTVAAARKHACHVGNDTPLWILAVHLAAGCLEHVEMAVVSCGVRRGRGRPQEVYGEALSLLFTWRDIIWVFGQFQPLPARP
jgi:hypothetical protein